MESGSHDGASDPRVSSDEQFNPISINMNISYHIVIHRNPCNRQPVGEGAQFESHDIVVPIESAGVQQYEGMLEVYSDEDAQTVVFSTTTTKDDIVWIQTRVSE